MPTTVAIVGVSGYAGGELARLVLRHPEARLVAAVARSRQGEPLRAVQPHLHAAPDSLVVGSDVGDAEVVFTALPAGEAAKQARAWLDDGRTVIDIGSDFRLRDPKLYERWYGYTHPAPDLLKEAVYGLTELTRDRIRGARLIANPGCYPTAALLALAPALRAGLVTEDIVIDAKSGVSGAGRKAELHLSYSEAADNFLAYNVPGHRHWPEIRQGLAQAARREVGLTFVPHLLPIIRGIHATLYARVTRELDFQALYEERYKLEPFVDLLPAGSHPETRSVRGANVCRIALHRPPQASGRSDMLVVLSVIDNLTKGAAGQAVQNMNLMFGLPETTGLLQPPLVP